MIQCLHQPIFLVVQSDSEWIYPEKQCNNLIWNGQEGGGEFDLMNFVFELMPERQQNNEHVFELVFDDFCHRNSCFN